MKKLLLLSLLLCSGAASAADSLTILKPGEKAPTFSLPTIFSNRVALRHYCGEKLLRSRKDAERRIVIVNFWATYCAPCQKEIPELTRFEKKHKDKVKLICINMDKEGKSLVGPFVKKKKYDITVGLDSYHHTAKRYGVKSLPALFVVDRRGIIRYSWQGYKDSLELRLEKMINQIENGAPVLEEPKLAKGEVKGVVEVRDSSGVQHAGPESSQKRSAVISARERWETVAAVECGRPIQEVAREIGATSEEIRSWYDDLKKAAMEIWKTEKN
ncbi:MAG: TlpA disulfide reductase family protein [Chitinispirillaceae bacterium]